MHHTSCKDAEIQFGRDDSPSETIVSAFGDTGQITITVQNREVPGQACDNELTLAQTIHLRDFLNRHIDGLALAATGSLAVRSFDDPTQLSSEELLEHRAMGGKVIGKVARYPHPDLVPGKVVDAPAGELHLVWDSSQNECVGFFEAEDADFAETGQHGLVRNGLAGAFRERCVADAGEKLPRTKITFY